MREQSIRIHWHRPGLRRTGWGVIESDGVRLTYVASGLITSAREDDLAYRLRELFEGLSGVIASFVPREAAARRTFVNENARATLKLGQARGMALLAPALGGLKVAEYPPKSRKKDRHRHGPQRQAPDPGHDRLSHAKAKFGSADEADALAIAICHANHRATERAVAMRVARQFGG